MIQRKPKQAHGNVRLKYFIVGAAAFILWGSLATVWAQPPILDAGMTPAKTTWSYAAPHDRSPDVRVKFWMQVQRQGYANRYGTFDYSFNARVFRPNGTEVWNTFYGFNEKGYSDIDFALPALFLERSADRTKPDFGNWKIRIAVTENASRAVVGVREFNLAFQSQSAKQPIGMPSKQDAATVYLSDLQETRSDNLHGGLGKDRPYWQQDLIIAGRFYEKGLVTHPVSENGKKSVVEYALNGAYNRFYASLGSAEDRGNYGRGTMNYCIVLDGRRVECGRFPSPSETKEIRIDVRGAKVLRLEVDNGDDGNHSDHAAWGDARLER